MLDGRSEARSAEGGCGVLGVITSDPVAGKHLIRPLAQMHNRGNGKGGGVCVAGCFPDYRDYYALHIGYLDPAAVADVEERHIKPFLEVERRQVLEEVDDFAEVGLTLRPPRVVRYFVRVKPAELERFAAQEGYDDLERAEDEWIYRSSFQLNERYYATVDDKAAFVLSHGKDLMILKGVGYAEEIARYYLLEEFRAHVWIGHQRYPTRGRVWHPGGAHPFSGMHEALVHNGDFANYTSICTYLRQRGHRPLFLTDTEVAVLLFDHYSRELDYPLEWVIEALAPTSDRDLALLPKARRRIYRALGSAHIHGSPDGPWFFIVARNAVAAGELQLIGITDTSMLRPHHFTLSTGAVDIGAVASEKQAVDAFLESYHAEDSRVCPVADSSWCARGGSATDGGSFVFALTGDKRLECRDKFGKLRAAPLDKSPPSPVELQLAPAATTRHHDAIELSLLAGDHDALFAELAGRAAELSFEDIKGELERLATLSALSDAARATALGGLAALIDRRFSVGGKKRSWLVALIQESLRTVLGSVPDIGAADASGFVRVDWANRRTALGGGSVRQALVVDCEGFPPEGNDAACRLIVEAYDAGYRRFHVYNLAGDRFIGCGLGANSQGTRIDCYGSLGDYAASGMDGAELYVHGDAQDQVGQIMKSGKLVVYGNVGQTFLYGAKGGTAYVLGNCGGRAAINAVGDVRAVLNGTCLDYAGESFMAGSDLGGGFLLLNGLAPNAQGDFVGLEHRYNGTSFFSLASGGAGYINDPYHSMTADQLNGTHFIELTREDWLALLPYLEENARLFGIEIERDLLTVDGVRKWPGEVFRKVTPQTPVRLDDASKFAMGMVESM